ncbi:hypothetical protein B0H17DRAFT_1103811 [Mycena rosella]|uniref:Secreted protein n=1 Tax=Mycena rosella TaxID=1033263 RepID=A0AAD7FZ22_MYCRO|nr:hypothetical protein B0H17DRAFT_1103811 [Mycena rosella]
MCPCACLATTVSLAASLITFHQIRCAGIRIPCAVIHLYRTSKCPLLLFAFCTPFMPSTGKEKGDVNDNGH